MSTGGQYHSCSCWQHYWYKPRCHWTSWQPHTLLAHIWLSTDQHFQLLFLCTVFQPLPHTCSDAWGCWDQGGELGLVELHPTGLSPSIQPVQIPPKGFPTLKQINASSQLGVICSHCKVTPLCKNIFKSGDKKITIVHNPTYITLVAAASYRTNPLMTTQVPELQYSNKNHRFTLVVKPINCGLTKQAEIKDLIYPGPCSWNRIPLHRTFACLRLYGSFYCKKLSIL